MAIQFLRGTKSAGYDTVPAAGQPFYATDTKELYVGDGTTTISQLSPMLTCGEQTLATSQQIQAAKNIGAVRGIWINQNYVEEEDSAGRLTIGEMVRRIKLNGVEKTPPSSGLIDLGDLVSSIQLNGDSVTLSEGTANLGKVTTKVGGWNLDHIPAYKLLYFPNVVVDLETGKSLTLDSIPSNGLTGHRVWVKLYIAHHTVTGGASDDYTVSFPTGGAYQGVAFWASGYANNYEANGVGTAYRSITAATSNRTFFNYSVHNKAKTFIAILYWRTDNDSF